MSVSLKAGFPFQGPDRPRPAKQERVLGGRRVVRDKDAIPLLISSWSRAIDVALR
jgi:hypothetical protein